MQERQNPSVTWRDRPLLNTKEASIIAGVSIASLYKQAKLNRLRFKLLAGRTMVETASLITFLDSAADWVPSGRSDAAVSTRIGNARAEAR